jgi:hypothetical protein
MTIILISFILLNIGQFVVLVYLDDVKYVYDLFSIPHFTVLVLATFFSFTKEWPYYIVLTGMALILTTIFNVMLFYNGITFSLLLIAVHSIISLVYYWLVFMYIIFPDCITD